MADIEQNIEDLMDGLKLVNQNILDLKARSLTFEDVEKATRNGTKDFLETVHDGLSGVAKETSRFEYEIKHQLNRKRWMPVIIAGVSSFVTAILILGTLYLNGQLSLWP